MPLELYTSTVELPLHHRPQMPQSPASDSLVPMAAAAAAAAAAVKATATAAPNVATTTTAALSSSSSSSSSSPLSVPVTSASTGVHLIAACGQELSVLPKLPPPPPSGSECRLSDATRQDAAPPPAGHERLNAPAVAGCPATAPPSHHQTPFARRRRQRLSPVPLLMYARQGAHYQPAQQQQQQQQQEQQHQQQKQQGQQQKQKDHQQQPQQCTPFPPQDTPNAYSEPLKSSTETVAVAETTTTKANKRRRSRLPAATTAAAATAKTPASVLNCDSNMSPTPPSAGSVSTDGGRNVGENSPLVPPLPTPSESATRSNEDDMVTTSSTAAIEHHDGTDNGEGELGKNNSESIKPHLGQAVITSNTQVEHSNSKTASNESNSGRNSLQLSTTSQIPKDCNKSSNSSGSSCDESRSNSANDDTSHNIENKKDLEADKNDTTFTHAENRSADERSDNIQNDEQADSRSNQSSVRDLSEIKDNQANNSDNTLKNTTYEKEKTENELDYPTGDDNSNSGNENNNSCGKKNDRGKRVTRSLSEPQSKSRCQSEPTSPTSAGKVKRKVSFADDKGLSLTEVRVMQESEISDLPRWTQSLLLHAPTQAAKAAVAAAAMSVAGAPTIVHTWEPQFAQPAADYAAFRRRLEQNSVALENVIVRKDDDLLTGTIKVRNLAFEKHVFVRTTFDCWTSYCDYPAMFLAPPPPPVVGSHPATTAAQQQLNPSMRPRSAAAATSGGGGGGGPPAIFDTFSFSIKVPASAMRSGIIEICVGYKTPQAEFWDNNGGRNYKIASISRRTAVPIGASTGSGLLLTASPLTAGSMYAFGRPPRDPYELRASPEGAASARLLPPPGSDTLPAPSLTGGLGVPKQHMTLYSSSASDMMTPSTESSWADFSTWNQVLSQGPYW